MRIRPSVIRLKLPCLLQVYCIVSSYQRGSFLWFREFPFQFVAIDARGSDTLLINAVVPDRSASFAENSITPMLAITHLERFAMPTVKAAIPFLLGTALSILLNSKLWNKDFYITTWLRSGGLSSYSTRCSSSWLQTEELGSINLNTNQDEVPSEPVNSNLTEETGTEGNRPTNIFSQSSRVEEGSVIRNNDTSDVEALLNLWKWNDLSFSKFLGNTMIDGSLSRLLS